MSRSDTFVELSPAALKIVEGCGKRHLGASAEQVEVVIDNSCRYTYIKSIPLLEPCVLVEEGPFKVTGMYDNQYPLSKYTPRDGTVYLEVEQENIWDSGPVIFTCLVDGSGTHIIQS